MNVDALLLVSFGGPEGPDDVLPFLERVTAGRGVPRERLLEVAHHYQLVGGVSPINGQNRALLAELRDALSPLPVYWGNRNWNPLLADALREMRADGVVHALAFVTSAFSSYSGCRQYLDDIAAARAQLDGDGGGPAPLVSKLRVYGNHPGFLDAMADRIDAALASLPAAAGPDAGVGAQVPRRIVFTAHSVPLSMATDSDYEAQLRDAAGLLADRCAPGVPWDLVWQSRSGPPSVPWLEPDIGDHLRALAASGTRQVVVVPLGFVSDHMEVVYDLDTEAAAIADELGLTLVRAGTVGTHPAFVAMVGELVAERTEGAERRAAGTRGAWPDPGERACRPGCCPLPARPAGAGRPAGAAPLGPSAPLDPSAPLSPSAP